MQQGRASRNRPAPNALSSSWSKISLSEKPFSGARPASASMVCNRVFSVGISVEVMIKLLDVFDRYVEKIDMWPGNRQEKRSLIGPLWRNW